MPSSSFLADAVIFKESSGSFTLDAEVLPRRFTADAWLVNDTFQQHHRLRDHFGADSDLYVMLSKSIGKYVEYTPVHYVLEDMMERLTYLEDYERTRSSFTLDAAITTNSIYIDAVIASTMSGPSFGFELEAWVRLGASFTFDARIHDVFTVDPFII